MDRLIVYPSEQPTDTVFLTGEREKMIALGYLAEGAFGTDTVADGLGCVPTVPPSLAVQILPGSIYQQEPVDAIGYASLGVDNVNQIVKQGVIQDITSLTLTPPATSGQAINYLIEASLLEQDTGITVLPYFNSIPPNAPLTGPAGSGTSQPTIRQTTLSLVAKAGVAATAGSQVTPAPDAGYIGLWVVTVANGASALTSAQISQYANAPFISVKLPQVPTWVQGGTWAWAVDSGTANQIIVDLTPTPINIQAGFEIRVKKMASPSNAGMTIIVNGAPAVAVVNRDGSALTLTTPMGGGDLARLIFDGTSWRWSNPSTSTAVGSLGASSGEGIDVSGGGVVSLNYPSLSIETALGNTDLWSFFSQADTHHRVLSWAQLLAAINAASAARLVGFQVFRVAGSGLYVPTVGTRIVLGICTGAGGGAGCSGPVNNGQGGYAGGTAIGIVPISGSVNYVVGAGGVIQNTATAQGNNGTASNFGTFLAASGGSGGWAPGGFNPSGAGSGTMGALLLTGDPGQFPTGGDQAGHGGSSFWGGAGAAGTARSPSARASPTAGNTGSGGGSGAAPGSSASPGMRGGDGIIALFEFS